MPELSFERGWRLYSARNAFPPGSLIDATNLAPDPDFGGLTTRAGQRPVAQVGVVATASFHSLYATYITGGTKIRYIGFTLGGAMTIRRNIAGSGVDTDLLTGLTSNFVTFTDMAEFNGPTIWTFFAATQVGAIYKDNGTNVRRWGIRAPGGTDAGVPWGQAAGTPQVAPTLAQIVGGGGLAAGTYTVAYLYVREASGVAVAVGNPSLVATQAVNANDRITVSNIRNPADPASADVDAQITHVYIYRSLVNGSSPLLFFDTKVAATGVGTLTATLSQADTALGALVETDNNPPPPFEAMCVHQEHIVGVSGSSNELFFSKRFRPESFSPVNVLEIGSLGDILTQVFSISGNLIVFTRQGIYIVTGGPDDATWVSFKLDVPVGIAPVPGSLLASIYTLAIGHRGLYFMGPDGIYVLSGTAMQNITDEKLYPLFHGETVNGFAPVNYNSVLQCVGGWFQGRYYFSYPSGANTINSNTIVYDEATDTWWPDSRAFRRLHYEKQDETFMAGGISDGTLRSLVYNEVTHAKLTDDDGTVIPVTFQSRDADEGIPDADKQLAEVVIDVDTSNVAATLTAIQDYGVSTTALGTITANGRAQQYATATFEAIRAKALGFKLTMSGVMKLYRVMPHLQVLPPTRQAYDVEPSDLGWKGQKRVEELYLDIELLSATSVTITPYADGVAQAGINVTTASRSQVQILSQSAAFSALLVGLAIRGNGTFRLWPGTQWGWTALPEWRRAFTIDATDLGYAGMKRFQNLVLDTQLSGAGTLTVTPSIDGVNQTAITITTMARTQKEHLLSAGWPDGHLVQLVFSSTVDFRLWPSSYVNFVPLPQERYRFDMPLTDLGTPVVKRIQALDVDFEIMDSAAVSIAVIDDSGATVQTLATTSVNGRYQRSLLGSVMRTRLIGLKFTSTGRFRLWPGTSISVTPEPEDLLAFAVPPTDLGHPGLKQFQAIDFDFEILDSTAITILIKSDGGTTQQTITTTATNGRYHQSLLSTAFTSKVLSLEFSSTGRFRLWPGTLVEFTPLPEDMLVFTQPPTDLGYGAKKRVQAIILDLEATVGAQTILLTVKGDGVTATTSLPAVTGRQQLQVLTATFDARLIELTLSSTSVFRIWSGSSIEFVPLPQDVRVFNLPPTDLGMQTMKRVQAIVLDLEASIGAQTIALTVNGDGVAASTTLPAITGRQQVQVLTATFDARLVDVALSSAQSFRIWGGSGVEFLALPQNIRAFNLPPTDLGYPSLKRFQDLELDLETSVNGQTVTIAVIGDGATQQTFLHTLATAGRQSISPMTPSFDAKLLALTLTSPNSFQLWPGNSVGWTPLPQDRKVYQWPQTDMGVASLKRFQSLDLDLELLEAGTLTLLVKGDGATIQTFTTTTVARLNQSILTATFDARLLSLEFSSTGRFRLWPGSNIGWIPLPPDRYVYNVPASDLGWAGHKIVQYVVLDTEQLAAGTITVTLIVDGVTISPTITQTAVTRTKTRRMRIPPSAIGRLVEVRFSAPSGFRLWPGTELGWTGIGATHEGIQRAPIEQMDLAATAQRTPLVQAGMTEPQRSSLTQAGLGQAQKASLAQAGLGQAQKASLAQAGLGQAQRQAVGPAGVGKDQQVPLRGLDVGPPQAAPILPAMPTQLQRTAVITQQNMQQAA